MTIYFSPEYQQARQTYDRLAQQYGEDSQQAIDQFMKMFHVAPQELKDMAGDMAKEMGLIPHPSGYSDDGEPLFSTSDLAKHFGLDENQVIADLQRLDPTLASVHKGNFNRIQ